MGIPFLGCFGGSALAAGFGAFTPLRFGGGGFMPTGNWSVFGVDGFGSGGLVYGSCFGGGPALVSSFAGAAAFTAALTLC